MKIGVFAGSFCPITIGHLDAIKRFSKLVDKLFVVVAVNFKKNNVIDEKDRLLLVKKATSKLKNVECVCWNGLLVDFCMQNNVDVMFKVVRNSSEMQQVVETNDINVDLWKGETVFVVADRNLRHVSSSLVRELAFLKKDFSMYVPENCYEDIKKFLV